MSIAELTAPRLPRHTGRTLRRQTKLVRRNVRRTVRRRVVRISRTVTTWQHSQYYIWTAYADARRAIARNEDIFLGALLIVGIVLFAFANTSAQLGLMLFMNLTALADDLALGLIPLMGMFCLVLAIVGIWVAAWLMNLVSFALMDGANRRQLTSLRYTLRRSLMHATRTAGSWLLYVTVAFVPVAIIGLWALIYIVFATDMNDTVVIRTTLVALSAAVTWLLYALTSYGLVPHVALFEPELPLTKALGRSRQLVLRRGRPFIFALYLLCGAAIAGAYFATDWLTGALGSASTLLFVAVVAGTVLAMRLGMTMLYRKRKFARS